MQDGQKKNIHMLPQTGMPVPGRNLQVPGCPPLVQITRNVQWKIPQPQRWSVRCGICLGQGWAPTVPPLRAEVQPGLWPLPESSLQGGSPWCCSGAAACEITSAPTQTLNKHQLQPCSRICLPSEFQSLWCCFTACRQSPDPLSDLCFTPCTPKSLSGYSQLCLWL